MEPDVSLQDATTDQIVDELARRCDGLILANIASLTPKVEGFTSYYRGGLTVCIGLCERLKIQLLNTCSEPQEEEE